MAGTTYKGLIGEEDLSIFGKNDTSSTFTRTTSTGGSVTLTRVGATDMVSKYRLEESGDLIPFVADLKAKGPWYDVRAYNAKGDGTTDDSTAIQDAIDAASAAGGGTVYLPAGTYLIGTGLDLYQDVSLIGDGWDATILKASAAIDVITMASDNYYFCINRLQVDGDNKATKGILLGDATTTSGWGTLREVYVKQCVDGIVTNRCYHMDLFVYVSRCTGNGLEIEDSQSNIIHGWLESNGRDLYLHNTANDNRFYGIIANKTAHAITPDYNIVIDDACQGNIIGGQLENQITPSSGYCVHIGGQSSYNRLDGLNIYTGSTPDTDYNLIRVGVSTDAGTANGNVITKCRFYAVGAGYAQVYLGYSDTTIVEHCYTPGLVHVTFGAAAAYEWRTVYTPYLPEQVKTPADGDTLRSYDCGLWIECDATAGTFELNMPAASRATGQTVKVRKIDSSINRVELTRTDGNVYNPGNTVWLPLMSQHDYAVVWSDGTNWIVLEERRRFSASITPAQVNANTSAAQTFATFYGISTPEDKVTLIEHPELAAGLHIDQVLISADNTLKIYFSNTTGGNLTPAAGAYTVQVYR